MLNSSNASFKGEVRAVIIKRNQRVRWWTKMVHWLRFWRIDRQIKGGLS